MMKEYYSVNEIAATLGKHRATIWDRIALLAITTHKFPRDRKTYIAASDVERIREVLGQPWLAGEEERARKVIQE